MALNKTFSNIAYLAGRITAILEMAERNHEGDNARSVVARYAEIQNNPQLIIGQLLSYNHVRNGITPKLDAELQQVYSMVPAEGLPSRRLTLEEWSTFGVGYQHEKKELR